MTNDSPIGVLHGATQYVIQDDQGEIEETESISAGLDYPGVSPLHCFLKETGRARYTSASDEEALKAYQLVSKLENISPIFRTFTRFCRSNQNCSQIKIH